MSKWIDLLDPSEEEITAHGPDGFDRRLLTLFTRPADPLDGARPFLRGFGRYVAGIVVAAVLDPEGNHIYYQEVDLIITREQIVTIRKTSPDEEAYDPTTVEDICSHKQHLPPGRILYYLFEDVAERYLDLLDGLDEEVDELEENLTGWPSERVRRRLSELRHDLLRVRRTLSPTRDAVRGVVDGRIDIDHGMFRREIFSEEIEQNEVIKRLTVTASLLLFPTFIVGVYGQNFDHMPELHWYLGYVFSWGLIALATVGQLVFFRWKKWI